MSKDYGDMPLITIDPVGRANYLTAKKDGTLKKIRHVCRAHGNLDSGRHPHYLYRVNNIRVQLFLPTEKDPEYLHVHVGPEHVCHGYLGQFYGGSWVTELLNAAKRTAENS